jgi:hypothetical protein
VIKEAYKCMYDNALCIYTIVLDMHSCIIGVCWAICIYGLADESRRVLACCLTIPDKGYSSRDLLFHME